MPRRKRLGVQKKCSRCGNQFKLTEVRRMLCKRCYKNEDRGIGVGVSTADKQRIDKAYKKMLAAKYGKDFDPGRWKPDKEESDVPSERVD